MLDLYAGTGSLALEAAARGAARIVLVEQDEAALAAIRKNLRSAPRECDTALLAGDVVHWLGRLSRRRESFDIVLADPPYDCGEVARVLSALADSPVMAPGAVAVIEHSPRERGPESAGPLVRTDERRYGQTHVSFFSAEFDPDEVHDEVPDEAQEATR